MCSSSLVSFASATTSLVGKTFIAYSNNAAKDKNCRILVYLKKENFMFCYSNRLTLGFLSGVQTLTNFKVFCIVVFKTEDKTKIFHK